MYIIGLAVPEPVEFQLSVRSDSIPLPEMCAKSAKSYAGFCSFDSYLILNAHCPGQIGDFINNLQLLLLFFFHSQCLSLRCTTFHVQAGQKCHMLVTSNPHLIAFLSLIWHSLPGHLHRGACLAHLSAP